MHVSSKLEQRIAVFGESGSGKTVLLSSFYGATQEPAFAKDSLFNIVADDLGQGSRLHQNYLGMRNSARLPQANHFLPASYAFTVKLKENDGAIADKSHPFDALSLVWHDYPGEWFEQDVSGEEEAQRRVDTFRSLMSSDVALLLIDGQLLLENQGEEERYLKSVFGNFRNGLLSLKDRILKNGHPLVEFPRIWILALSKSDLLPDLDVYGFRDILVEKAGEEIVQLREVIAGFVEAKEALSVGEDFMLLSSAAFEPGKIEVAHRVGVELILPIAAIMPFERHLKWVKEFGLPQKVAENLLDGAASMAGALVGKNIHKFIKLPPWLEFVAKGVDPAKLLYISVTAAGEQLRRMNEKAKSNHDSLGAVLTGFKMDIENGVRDYVLIESKK